MIKINKLDSSIYNRISAGEVVERPASVVKELMENSIDAGASSILVSVSGGGIANITVTDDGCGISAEYVKTAFLPHATSKISAVGDLDDISTLGFRGEALASIASVSKIEMKTRAYDEETGVRISLAAGEVGIFEVWGGNVGTSISVSDLFYNTPARAKFLKTQRGELAEITELVRELILANPEISVKYVSDGNVVYQSFGQGLVNALHTVYTKDFCDKLLPVGYEAGGYSVFGYVGSPQLTKANRNYQSVIVNGRTVKNQTVGIAAAQAYGNRLMKRCFPVFVLNIVMPFDDLDVNVHPSKTEVRFKNQNVVFSIVYNAIKNALDGTGFFTPTENFESNKDSVSPPQNSVGQIAADVEASENINKGRNISVEECAFRSDDVVRDSGAALMKPFGVNGHKSENSAGNASNNYENRLNSELYLSNSDAVAPKGNVSSENRKLFDADFKQIVFECAKSSVDEFKFDLSRIRILGQIFLTYILLTDEENFYVIDQHAAQERIFYDSLTQKSGKEESQYLLVPFVEKYSPKEYGFITENAKVFADFGFTVDEFGDNTIKVSAVPSKFAQCDIRKIFEGFLSEKNMGGNIEFAALKERFAQSACKAAIKHGDLLTEKDIEALLAQMNEGMPLQCPHGRPAVIKMSQKDFDKMFKRIV